MENPMIGRLKRMLAIGTVALAAVAGMSAMAVAQGPLLEVYVAFVGPSDHYNSRGERLTEPWQIIRQDRANFHRFGIRDPGDQGDRYFASSANRARMERMLLNGYIDANARWQIVNDNVWIRVEIYADAVNVTVN